MANTLQKIRTYLLSSNELNQLTDWNPALIEEWLNLFENIATLAESVDQSEVFTDQISTEFDEQFYLSQLSAARNARAVDSDASAISGEIIVCTGALTVTLDDQPRDQEVTTVKITNGDVVIDANGKTIDGQDSILFEFDAFVLPPSIDCKYLAETDEWYIV